MYILKSDGDKPMYVIYEKIKCGVKITTKQELATQFNSYYDANKALDRMVLKYPNIKYVFVIVPM